MHVRRGSMGRTWRNWMTDGKDRWKKMGEEVVDGKRYSS